MAEKGGGPCPGSGVTLLLRFGAAVSTVGWNVLGLQPVGVIFHKDKCSLS
jgi:hypothetical protein